MNRSFFKIPLIVIVFLACTMGATPSVHAQNTTTFTSQTALDAYNACIENQGTEEQCNAAYEIYLGSVGTTIQNDPAAEKTPLDLKLGGDTGEKFGEIASWIMSLFAWLVGVAMLTLDYAAYYTVVTMGTYVNDLSAIGVTWQILRDLGNIILIFGFLAIGITTILNVDWYGGGTKLLPKLLIAAVFLNFSLFITEAIIDTGNLFATQFYKQINGGNLPTPTGTGITGLAVNGVNLTTGNEGISTKIMSQLGLQTLYANGQVNQKLFKGGNLFLIGFLGIILFIVAAFVMFSLAFILIARFVILLFLIILAPIGFAGLAIPQLAGRAKQWWDTLFEQTLTAPILFLTLYIALAIITDASFLTGFGINATATGATGTTGFWTGAIENGNLVGFAGILITFLVAMGLLLAVTIFAKKLSAFGAGWAMKTAGALSFGATAWAGRNTGGWLANKTARGLRKTWVARVPLAGTGLVKGLDRVAGASFDVRGATMGGGLKATGIDAGTAQKGGYKAELKGRIESRTKYAAELKGRELTDEEKIDQKVEQNKIKATEKRLADLQVHQRALAAAGKDTKVADEEIATEKELLTRFKEKLDEIESVTDKGAQRKYANALNLWTDPKNRFNRIFNFAANTEAAEKIRGEAKKSSDDKTLDSLKKALKKASGEEETPATTPPPTAAPSAGGASGAAKS